jgi:hypothetical protein
MGMSEFAQNSQPLKSARLKFKGLDVTSFNITSP